LFLFETKVEGARHQKRVIDIEVDYTWVVGIVGDRRGIFQSAELREVVGG
jgi:hypothetical protein